MAAILVRGPDQQQTALETNEGETMTLRKIVIIFLLSLLAVIIVFLGLQKRSYILIIDNGSPLTSKIQQYVESRGIATKLFSHRASLKEITRNKYHGVILSGGPLLYSSQCINIEEVSINIALLNELTCPFLGICFGHQTIVESFAGKMEKMPREAKGLQKVNITKPSDLFVGLSNEILVYQGHNDCATQEPACFDVIAASDTCPIEAIQHKSKPIFGVQFHPEASGQIGQKVLANFLRICDKYQSMQPSF